MKNILIIGAYGQIAQYATDLFLERTDAHLTLYLRHAKRLQQRKDNNRITIIEGDATDTNKLSQAMIGQDVVYANLSGDMKAQAQAIIAAMNNHDIRRLIFISSMGIYGEIPGQNYNPVLNPYRDSAALIEQSGLDYTIIRPEWLNDNDEIHYGTTQRNEPFKNANATVSRKSVADLIVKLATTPNFGIQQSLGVHHL
ncbi:MAG: NAD(P)H-binding protein [Alphaproteobacteria bacterium]